MSTKPAAGQTDGKTQEIDPTHAVNDYAAKHHFEYARVRAKVEERIAYYQGQEDLRLRCLAAIYKKDQNKAANLCAEKGKVKGKTDLKEQRQKVKELSGATLKGRLRDESPAKTARSTIFPTFHVNQRQTSAQSSSGEPPGSVSPSLLLDEPGGDGVLVLAQRTQKLSELEKAKRELVLLIEEVVGDFRLAGDANYINYEFDKALGAYQESFQYVAKDEVPTLWADMQILIGNANQQISIRSEGPAIHQHRKAGLTAYQQALTVYTRDQFPQAWAEVQNNLGNTLKNQGIRTGGEAGRRLLAQAVAAYQAALQVYTREHLPEPWAQTHNNLAETYLHLEEWTQAAESYRNVLTLYPDYEKAYQLANSVYHEKLFAHEKAFALNQQWLARHPDDLSVQANFAEAHIATGRFVEADTRLASLISNPQLPPATAAGLRALDIVNLVALNKTDLIPGRLDALRSFIASQPETFIGEWSFEGTKHFISQHERFAKDRAWLLDLLTGLEGKKRNEMLAAINAAVERVR